MRSLHARQQGPLFNAQWPERNERFPGLWTSHDLLSSSFPLVSPPIHSRQPQRHRFRLQHRLHDPKTTAKSSRTTFAMSADDIDDELFALAGGDEDADVEEGEA
jgi:hypothetical protein